MIVSIASGKGGTGKTTIATNLALSIENAQLIDFDVEEPNANVFLKAKIEEVEEVAVDIPEIDEEKCDHCGECSKFCRYNALAVLPSKVLVFPGLCHSCGGCKLVCPRDAISWKKIGIGKIEHGMAGELDFYHGILNIGEIKTIQLLKALKKKIDRRKEVILDSPPGTSCPVIETISSSDYCILVTEPTPFGLHDLKLAVDVVRTIGVPFGVIINRDGVGNEKVEEYCHNENIPILMKIPHSREIAHLYSEGIAFATEMDEWRNKFKEMFRRIKEEVGK